jgi:hypothetical protein
LDEWLRVQAEKDDDNLALLKYSKEDDLKIKELSLSIEKLIHEVNKKKANLTMEVAIKLLKQRLQKHRYLRLNLIRLPKHLKHYTKNARI